MYLIVNDEYNHLYDEPKAYKTNDINIVKNKMGKAKDDRDMQIINLDNMKVFDPKNNTWVDIAFV